MLTKKRKSWKVTVVFPFISTKVNSKFEIQFIKIPVGSTGTARQKRNGIIKIYFDTIKDKFTGNVLKIGINKEDSRYKFFEWIEI